MYRTGFLNRTRVMQTRVAPSPQIFDLLQYSQTERLARENFRQRMHDLRDWKNYVLGRNFEISESLVQMQTARLRKSACDAARDYKEIRGNRIKIFQNYIEELPVVGIYKRLVS